MKTWIFQISVCKYSKLSLIAWKHCSAPSCSQWTLQSHTVPSTLWVWCGTHYQGNQTHMSCCFSPVESQSQIHSHKLPVCSHKLPVQTFIFSWNFMWKQETEDYLERCKHSSESNQHVTYHTCNCCSIWPSCSLILYQMSVMWSTTFSLIVTTVYCLFVFREKRMLCTLLLNMVIQEVSVSCLILCTLWTPGLVISLVKCSHFLCDLVQYDTIMSILVF